MKIGILENYLKMEVLKIKFKNWNFEELFENEIFFKIKFKNWNFEKLFENGIFFKKVNFLTLKDEELR